MDVLGNGWFWWNFPSKRSWFHSKRAKSQDSVDGDDESTINGRRRSFNFPLKQAATAASLAFTGDTIAQIRDRWKNNHTLLVLERTESEKKDVMSTFLSNHDWLRALRMASYGFFLYGPGSYAWYQFLDHSLPKQTFENLSFKVILNQIVLGPIVIAVVFAWNSLWQGNLSKLPKKYRMDALPTLLYGFKFWIPASILNFWAVPLQARVAFMSTCSIFWNFYLSSTMSK